VWIPGLKRKKLLPDSPLPVSERSAILNLTWVNVWATNLQPEKVRIADMALCNRDLLGRDTNFIRTASDNCLRGQIQCGRKHVCSGSSDNPFIVKESL
jgi:hypothetical protein